MITLHPAGIPHGPHPGTVEKSIGAKETKELAVMVDTFHPLQLTELRDIWKTQDIRRAGTNSSLIWKIENLEVGRHPSTKKKDGI